MKKAARRTGRCRDKHGLRWLSVFIAFGFTLHMAIGAQAAYASINAAGHPELADNASLRSKHTDLAEHALLRTKHPELAENASLRSKHTDLAENASLRDKHPERAENASLRVKYQLTVRSSPDASFETYRPLNTRQWRSTFRHPRAVRRGLTEPLIGDVELIRLGVMGTTRYGVTAGGSLYDRTSDRTIRLSAESASLLREETVRLRNEHYGKPLEWSEAKRTIPRMAVVRITDLETGLSLAVQRRAGSAHADVQPVTSRDSALLKTIYGGEWSWHRRAIVVQTDTGRFAASMNGMPHGGDGIPDNDFDGHFCIHLLGSTTHRSRVVDLMHQTMAHKAAGRLERWISGLRPEQLAEIYIGAVHQHDRALYEKLAPPPEETRDARSFDGSDPKIKSLRPLLPLSANINPSGLIAVVPVRADLLSDDAPKKRIRLEFELARFTPANRWRIAQVRLIE